MSPSSSALWVISIALVLIVGLSQGAKADKLPSSITSIFGKGLSLLLGQKYEPEDSVGPIFKEYALRDESNDEIIKLTVQQVIERSGFKTETQHSISDDGYITELIRIINPLADKRKLKQPPVMLLQGGISDQSIWIWASAIQHHPERYPRLPQDGPITSWNRSLGFVLANNGYDVWLVGTRGSNDGNKGHIKFKGHKNWMDESKLVNGSNQVAWGKENRGLVDTLSYWDYSMDELANFELPRQIDKIMNLTGSQKVSLVPISLSSIISMIFISAQPEYKAKIHNMAIVAPIINNQGTNNLLSRFHRGNCKYLPAELGTILYTEILLSNLVRGAIKLVGKSKELRYTLVKALTFAYAGPSPKYLTLLEPGVLDRIALPTGFKEIKHYCQQVVAGRLQRYDHGPAKNRRIYGTMSPRRYDMGAVDFGNWMVISGGNDKFATIKSVQQYIRTSKTPPLRHVYIEKYNHLDLIAALDNDVQVNLPILEFLDQFSIDSSANVTQDSFELNRI